MTLPWWDGRTVPPRGPPDEVTHGKSPARRKRYKQTGRLAVAAAGAGLLKWLSVEDASPVWALALIAMAIMWYLQSLADDGIVPRVQKTGEAFDLRFHAVREEVTDEVWPTPGKSSPRRQAQSESAPGCEEEAVEEGSGGM